MKSRGFTLIELMITVAIVAIIAAVAIPAYREYVRESRLGAMRMNLDTLRIAVEAFRLDSTQSNYGASLVSGTAIDTRYGWRPEGDSGAYTYTVSPTSAATPTYSIWAVATGGIAWARCDKAATTFKCCDGKGTSTSACP